MTKADEIVHELKRLRMQANKDVDAENVKNEDFDLEKFNALRNFRGGLTVAVRVAEQINNREHKS